MIWMTRYNASKFFGGTMTKLQLYFMSYRKLGYIPTVEGIEADISTTMLPSHSPGITERVLAQHFGDYADYKTYLLRNSPEVVAAREEVMRKSPYDGKSTFAELLEEGVKSV